jgi:hypothetical protein
MAADGSTLGHMNTSRFVAVNLTDAEWHALRALTADPAVWMKSQIQRFLDESGVTPSQDEEHDTLGTLELAD